MSGVDRLGYSRQTRNFERYIVVYNQSCRWFIVDLDTCKVIETHYVYDTARTAAAGLNATPKL